LRERGCLDRGVNASLDRYPLLKLLVCGELIVEVEADILNAIPADCIMVPIPWRWCRVVEPVFVIQRRITSEKNKPTPVFVKITAAQAREHNLQVLYKVTVKLRVKFVRAYLAN